MSSYAPVCGGLSPPIVREVGRVLRLDFQWNEPAVIARLKILIRVANLVVPDLALNVVTADPDDNRIVECAVAGNASIIVSGDSHLLKLKDFQGIGIVRPIDFLRMLE